MTKKKISFNNFLKGLLYDNTSMAEYSLYVADYFEQKEYIKLFGEYEAKENNDEEVDDDEIYQMYLKMLESIKRQYPTLYKKMDKYIDENY